MRPDARNRDAEGITVSALPVIPNEPGLSEVSTAACFAVQGLSTEGRIGQGAAGGGRQPMNDDQVFRFVLIAGFLVLFPVGAYHRLKSQATGERLDRLQGGIFILIFLRLLGWAGL